MDNHTLIKSQIIAEMIISQGDEVVMMVNNMLHMYLQNVNQNVNQSVNHNVLGTFVSTGSNESFESFEHFESFDHFEKAKQIDIFSKSSQKSKKKSKYSEQEQELRKNAYLKFKSEKLNQMSAFYADKSASFISKHILYQWRRLSQGDKDAYIN